MSRTVDREQRRQDIAEAAVHIARTGGIAEVTVARVAARAGISVGLVQHYFPSKDLLVARAHRELLAATDLRVARIVEDGERRGLPIRSMVVAALGELLPLDDRRRQECRARSEFLAMAGRTDGLAEAARASDRAQRERLRQVVDNATRCGEAPPETDRAVTAARLWATVTGAASAMLVDPDYPGRQVLAAEAEDAFPGRCRHHGPVGDAPDGRRP